MLTVREVAKRTGRNPETVRRWIWDGKLAAHKVGNQLFVDEADFARHRGGGVTSSTVDPMAQIERMRALRAAIRAEGRDRGASAAEILASLRAERDLDLAPSLSTERD